MPKIHEALCKFYHSIVPSNKQFEKMSFVLDLIEQIDIVPRKYFKKLKDFSKIEKQAVVFTVKMLNHRSRRTF